MDSRQEFEKWFNERFENLNVEPAIYAEFERAKNNMKYGFMGCQALNDKRIAELEAKLKVASEALRFVSKELRMYGYQYESKDSINVVLRTALEQISHD